MVPLSKVHDLIAKHSKLEKELSSQEIDKKLPDVAILDVKLKLLDDYNNSRKKFFGEEASVLQNRHQLKQQIPQYNHLNLDITGNQFFYQNIFTNI